MRLILDHHVVAEDTQDLAPIRGRTREAARVLVVDEHSEAEADSTIVQGSAQNESTQQADVGTIISEVTIAISEADELTDSTAEIGRLAIEVGGSEVADSYRREVPSVAIYPRWTVDVMMIVRTRTRQATVAGEKRALENRTLMRWKETRT